MTALEALAHRAGRLVTAAFPSSSPTPRVRNSYDSASQGRRTMGWRPSAIGPNAATIPNLPTLVAQSRDRYRNDPYGGAAIDHRVEQMVGCGIWPKSTAEDQAFRVTVQTLFLRWATECDADGMLDFAGLLTQATREWQEAGEVFTRLRPRLASDGLAVPLQLQVLERELCPLSHTTTAANGNPIRAGIERNKIGRREAYYFYPTHPGDGDTFSGDASRLLRIRASDVLHMYQPLRAGQLRGVPHLHRTLLTLRDLDLGDDATLMRWQLSNMFMGSFKRGAPPADASIDPITNRSIQLAQNELPAVGMEPGAIPVLQHDEELTFNDPPEAGNTYEVFMRQQLRKVAAGTRTPYHALTGDMAQVNDRTIRVILQDFRRSLEQLQWQILIHQFCQPIWTSFFEAAVFSGALQVPASFFAEPEKWVGVEWSPDRFGYINPVQDVEADVAEIRGGLSSRTLKVKARGEDIEDIDKQRGEDNRRDRDNDCVSDSDPSATDRTGKTVLTAAAPDAGQGDT